MNKLSSIVLLVAGIVLLGYASNSSDSLGSHFSRFFTGAPTDKTIWLMIAGAVAVAAGSIGLLRRPSTS
jgi:drug/metabolite transporter (DMT)-like permease